MKPTHIVIHCSATKDSGTVSWGAIRRYHKSYAYQGEIIDKTKALVLIGQGKYVKKPWSDIGYHYGIELVGDQYEILMGRMPNKRGAHCRAGGMNEKALGICCLGDFDRQPPSTGLWQKNLELVGYLTATFHIPKEHVIGHHEVEPHKTCPGTRFHMPGLRALL